MRRGLPGDPDDTHSRYIDTASSGIAVGCFRAQWQPGAEAEGFVRTGV